MKKVFYAIFWIAIFALGFATWRSTQAENRGRPGYRQDGPPKVAVEVGEVGTREMVEIGQFSGTLIPLTEFSIAPKVSGRLRKLHVNVGDTVEQGALIAELDDEEYVQALAQAQAELSIARANVKESAALLEIGNREFQRVKAMRAQKVSSEAEVETAQAQLESRRARHQVNISQVALKESAVEAARIRLSYTKLSATWNTDSESVPNTSLRSSSGRGIRHVSERSRDEGALLSPNTAIVSIADLNTIIAVVDVVERDYYKLKIGQTAQVKTAALPGRVFQGTVVRIAPVLDPSTRQARVEIEIPNPDFILKPGMFVSVHITFDRHLQARTIPSAALVRRNGNTGVFLVDDAEKKAVFQIVEPGIITRDFAEIASPVISGHVVTLGHHLLEDGSLLRLPGKAEDRPDETKARGKGGAEKPDRATGKGG